MTQQHDPLFDFDARQRAEDIGALPNYWDFPTLEQWCDYMDEHDPLPQTAEWARSAEERRVVLAARIAALDSLGDCAGYARMVLKAWRGGQS